MPVGSEPAGLLGVEVSVVSHDLAAILSRIHKASAQGHVTNVAWTWLLVCLSLPRWKIKLFLFREESILSRQTIQKNCQASSNMQCSW